MTALPPIMTDDQEREFLAMIDRVVQRTVDERQVSHYEAVSRVADLLRSEYPEVALSFVLRRPDGQIAALRAVERLISDEEAKAGKDQ